MAQITDKVISKVYEGKVIEGKGQFFNFYLQGGKKKYGYFVGKGKVFPSEGMKIAVMEYETSQDGEYENNKVTKLVWMGADQPTVSAKSTTASAGDKNSPIWFCLSYAKDLQCSMIATGKAKDGDLMQLGLETAMCAIDMLRFIQNPAELMPKEKPKDMIEEALNAGPDDSNIPF
jgi:hypothetical protein